LVLRNRNGDEADQGERSQTRRTSKLVFAPVGNRLDASDADDARSFDRDGLTPDEQRCAIANRFAPRTPLPEGRLGYEQCHKQCMTVMSCMRSSSEGERATAQRLGRLRTEMSEPSASALVGLLVIAGIFAMIFILDRRDEARLNPNLRRRRLVPSAHQMLLIAKWIIGGIGTIVAFSASVYQLGGGPFWWTAPEVDPGTADFSEPFNVPFTVHNRSSIFAIYAHFYCQLAHVRYEPSIFIDDSRVDANQISKIDPLFYPSFRCWYPHSFPGAKLTFAEIDIYADYRHNLPWNDTNIINAGTFYWDTRSSPPRWIKGKMLQ
jgi:hypothetical protein